MTGFADGCFGPLAPVYSVELGPPNDDEAEYLKTAFLAMYNSKFKDHGAYIDALFLGNYREACKELQRTLRALPVSADTQVAPHSLNGTAVTMVNALPLAQALAAAGVWAFQFKLTPCQ